MDTTDIPLPLPVILDGATGTNLIAAGLPEGVCVESWILENPEIIVNLQKSFAEAGSDIVYAPSFSANSEKLASFGLENSVAELNAELVALSKRAVDGKALVAGDISPTGRFLLPYGDIDFFDLFSVFFKQAKALAEAGADLFIIETMHSLGEARAAVLACRKLGLPIFVTMTVDENGRTLTGASALSSLICLQELGIAAFGLNCSSGPDAMCKIISEIAPFAKLPLIAKPNAGAPDENGNYALTPEKMADEVKELLAAGAGIVGGCCGTTPEHIRAIAKVVREAGFRQPMADEEPQKPVLSNETDVFFLSADIIEPSDYIRCAADMSDALLDCAGTSLDIIAIELMNHDDAVLFAQNAHMASLPVMFKSDSATAITTALILYNGRAAIDSRCELPRETLDALAEKFGAIVY